MTASITAILLTAGGFLALVVGLVAGTALFAAWPAQALFWLTHLSALYATPSACSSTTGRRAATPCRTSPRGGDLKCAFYQDGEVLTADERRTYLID